MRKNCIASARAARGAARFAAAAPLVVLLAAGVASRAHAASSGDAGTGGATALSAGTIYLVEEGRLIEGGGTVLVRDGRIVAVGKDLELPADAALVDYGPSAVIAPGFIAADSSLAEGMPGQRTADPGLSAIDGFDFYADLRGVVAGGVTSAYLRPARFRLISGQGAIVKLAGEDMEARVLRAPCALNGAISAEARNTPGYWEIPLPPTAQTGLGIAEPQLPKTLMGATVALRELVQAARAGIDLPGYGEGTTGTLAGLMRERLPWRVSAVEEVEVLALLALADELDLPLVIEGASAAGAAAEEIAAAGAAVVFTVPFAPNGSGVDRGKAREARWPEFDVPARLAASGARVAIATSPGMSPRDLRFAASLASRGGLDPAVALRAITLTPAEIYGVAARVGSIAPGKDADLTVLSGAPLADGTSVLATWIDGQLAWSIDSGTETSDADGDDRSSRSVVLEVEELHVGDGEVLRPGQILMEHGRIVEVGERVGHPAGALVVRGAAAMPGMIDALGHLGLEGAGDGPGTDFKLGRLIGPGDFADRRVARAGVTTVLLTPRGTNSSGTPIMAYKPAADSTEGQIVEDPAAVRLRWSDRNRAKSGGDVRELLEKLVKYDEKWLEYEKALAAWKPEPESPKPPPAADEAQEGEAKDEGEKSGEAKEGADKKEGEKKDEDKPKKKKGEEEPEDPDPVTGIWEASITLPPSTEPSTLRLQLRLEPETAGAPARSVEDPAEGSGARKVTRKVNGSLRCDALSSELVSLSGTWADKRLTLQGVGTGGLIAIAALIEKDTLRAVLVRGSAPLEFEAARKSREVPVAERSERRAAAEAEDQAPAAPKGKPEAPKIDERLEPLRLARRGEKAVIVEVERADEILACVAAFEAAGIEPILLGAGGASSVADEIRGRVAGVLPGPAIAIPNSKRAAELDTPYAALQRAGLAIAFRSNAEEGSADLGLIAAYAVSQGLSPTGALVALTSGAARMLCIHDRVGRLAAGLDADVLLLDGSPCAPSTQVLRAFVNGKEVTL